MSVLWRAFAAHEQSAQAGDLPMQARYLTVDVAKVQVRCTHACHMLHSKIQLLQPDEVQWVPVSSRLCEQQGKHCVDCARLTPCESVRVMCGAGRGSCGWRRFRGPAAGVKLG